MKRIAILVLLLGLVGTFSISVKTSAQVGNVEQTLMQIERDWAQALAKHDQAALDRILAVDWAVITADGQLMTKAQADAEFKTGATKYEAFAVDDMKVRMFGNTAIVTGRSTVKGTYKGKDISGQERFTDVFVQRAGRWQAVSTHVTRIAKS